MNKPKTEYRKRLIRNFKKPIPKIEVQQFCDVASAKSSQQKVPKIDEDIDDSVSAHIKQPQVNSTKCIKKRMNNVEALQPRKFKDVSELPKSERETVDEKITKQMNFPFDQILYKELISLRELGKPILQPVLTSYEPAIRDKVPRLDDFYMPRLKAEYSIPASTTLGTPALIRDYDGLRLYKVTLGWRNNYCLCTE